MQKKPKNCACINFGFDVHNVIQDLQEAEFMTKKEIFLKWNKK